MNIFIEIDKDHFPFYYRENTGHKGEGIKSLKRATSIIGMANDISPDSWDHSELEKYGLGKGNSTQKYKFL